MHSGVFWNPKSEIGNPKEGGASMAGGRFSLSFVWRLSGVRNNSKQQAALHVDVDVD
jgi:hypothetical protein